MSLSDAVALAADWRKASASVANGACVEVASVGPRVLVRDSVNLPGPAVAYPAEAWRSFIDGTKAGVSR